MLNENWENPASIFTQLQSSLDVSGIIIIAHPSLLHKVWQGENERGENHTHHFQLLEKGEYN